MIGFKKLLIPLSAVCAVLSGIMLYHSLSGTAMIGCGVGSGCDNVMGSRWAYCLRNIPVSLPALALYVMMLVCSLYYDGKESSPLDRLIRPLLLVMAGSVVGCALWFGWLQAGVLHSFCKYCTLLHLLGCISAIVILVHCGRSWLPMFYIGLAAAALFAFVQSRTLPDVLYDSGKTESELPAFTDEDVFSIGPEDAEAAFTLLFDFQCEHCRKLHRLLPDACRDGRFKVLLCPVPLSSDCNPYIPDGIDRFVGSCKITRCALAIWYYRPDIYPEFESFLMDGEFCPTPDEVEAEAARILGDSALRATDNNRLQTAAQDTFQTAAQDQLQAAGQEHLQAALQDPRIDSYLSKVYELFGRTSSAGKGAVPRLIRGQQWMVVEADSVDGLVETLGSAF